MPLAEDLKRVETANLSDKKLISAFKNIIRPQKYQKRKKAKRAVPTGSLKQSLDFLKLGTKYDGTPFDKADFKNFDEIRIKHKAEFNSIRAGIRYAHLMSKANTLRIKRANNQVSDGRGITLTRLIRIENDVLSFRVKASSRSVHQEHLVRLKLEGWNDSLEQSTGTKPDSVKRLKDIARGYLSIDCDCKDYQFRYRYIATVGKFNYKTRETAYPKTTNPDGIGTACKHILKSAEKLQSPTIQAVLIKKFLEQREAIGFGDDKTRNSNTYFSDDDKDTMKKARRDKIDVEQAKKELELYHKATKTIKYDHNLQKDLNKKKRKIKEGEAQNKKDAAKNKKDADKNKATAKKNKVTAKEDKTTIKKLEAALKILTAKAKKAEAKADKVEVKIAQKRAATELTGDSLELMKYRFSTHKDTYPKQNNKELIKSFMKKFNVTKAITLQVSEK